MKKTLAAVATVAALSVGGLVSVPEKHLRIESADAGCVIADCRTYLGRGAWDDSHAEVDCRFSGPPAWPDGGSRWIGCTVGPAAYAVGGECLPVQCSVIAGENPTEYAP